MDIRRIAVAVALVAGISSVAGCGSSHHAQNLRPVQMRVVLSSDSLRLGYRLAATVIVDNRSGHPIPVLCGSHWFELGLANQTIDNVTVASSPGCVRGAPLKVGTSRFEFLIPSKFKTCIGGGSDGPSEPSCVLSGGPHNHLENPLLPAGRYQTEIALLGIDHALVDLPPAQTVTLHR